MATGRQAKAAAKRFRGRRPAAASPPVASQRLGAIEYRPSAGLASFVDAVRAASPLQIVGTEKHGVRGRLLKDLATELEIPTARLYDIVGVPKATAEKKAANDEVIGGAGGQATLALVKLLGMAKEIASRSTLPAAKDFDAAAWLGRWIEGPQPALGGRSPAELLDTPTGFAIVARTLGALESGAYV